MEYICKKFTLDRGNKLDLRLDSPFELPGNKWFCGLKEFSLEQKWSLANEEMIIIYQNGQKSLLKPGHNHSAAQIDKILEEMFPAKRKKRAIIGIGHDDDEVEDQVIYIEDGDDEEETQETAEKSEKKEEQNTDTTTSDTDKKTETTDKKEESKTGPDTKVEEQKSTLDTKATEDKTDPDSGKDSRREQIETDAQYVQKAHFTPSLNKKRKTEQVQTQSWNAPEKPKTENKNVKSHDTEVFEKYWNKTFIDDKEKERNQPVTTQSIVQGYTPIVPPAEALVSNPHQHKIPKAPDISILQKYASEITKDKTETDKTEEKTAESVTVAPKIPSQYPVPTAPKPLPDITLPKQTESNTEKSDATEVDIAVPVSSDLDDSDEDQVIVVDDERGTTDLPTTETTSAPEITTLPTEKEQQILPTVLPTEITTTLPEEEEEEIIPTVLSTEVTTSSTEEEIIVDSVFVNPFSSEFTTAGYKSIQFTKNAFQKYVVNFDEKYVSAIQVSDGFAKALGFTSNHLLLNQTTATDSPSSKISPSHICISIKNILRPLTDEKEAEIGTIPINDKDKVVKCYYQTPMWFKLETTRIDSLSVEFTDFFGNPIACDNAHGHFVLALANNKR